MKQTYLLTALIIVITACSTSRMAQCPDNEFRPEKFRTSLSLFEKKQLRKVKPIVLNDLIEKVQTAQKENIFESTPVVASLTNREIHSLSNISSVIESTISAPPIVQNENLNSVPSIQEMHKVSAVSIKSDKKQLKIKKEGNPQGMAIASLIMGIVGIFVAGIPLGILAIVFSGIALNRYKSMDDKTGKGIAIAGLILGIISLIGGIIVVAALAS